MKRLLALAFVVLAAAPLAAEITLPCPGTPGPAGPTGPAGPAGPTGPTGPAGTGPASTTHVWFPYPYPANSTSRGNGNVPNNTLRCWAWVPDLAATNFTKLEWQSTVSCGGGNFAGVAIYNADGSSRIVTTGAQSCAVTTPIVVTGLPAYSLTEGTKYQVCYCASTGVGSFRGADANGVNKMVDAFPVPLTTKAANACTVGAPPTTTGALTADADADDSSPIVLILGAE